MIPGYCPVSAKINLNRMQWSVMAHQDAVKAAYSKQQVEIYEAKAQNHPKECPTCEAKAQ